MLGNGSEHLEESLYRVVDQHGLSRLNKVAQEHQVVVLGSVWNCGRLDLSLDDRYENDWEVPVSLRLYGPLLMRSASSCVAMSLYLCGDEQPSWMMGW